MKETVHLSEFTPKSVLRAKLRFVFLYAQTKADLFPKLYIPERVSFVKKNKKARQQSKLP